MWRVRIEYECDQWVGDLAQGMDLDDFRPCSLYGLACRIILVANPIPCGS